MKYRILFAGSNKIAIDDLFDHLSEDYELMTTSIRYRDMDSHLQIFKPNMYVYCLESEKNEDIRHIAELRSYLTSSGVDIAIIGSKDECTKFQEMTMNMASLVITTPATMMDTVNKLDSFIKNKEGSSAVEERKHVLVIDDDPQMLRVIKELLHDRYDVATAVSGRIAYKFLEKKTTNLILLDFEMPEENGPQVLVKLRENKELADIPVLFLTGNTEKEKIKEAMSLNPQGYLVKPVDKDSLTDSIRKLIG